jgi:hypothetical protein
VTAPVGLRRFVDAPAPASVTSGTGERCELCRIELSDVHTHLVDLTVRALRCCCRACYFLFTPEGAGAGRYRPVPERYLRDPAFRLTMGQWDQLAIPVGLVFVFHHSGLGRPVACYPSPAGATESLLALPAWENIRAANPEITDAEPDVEAVLLRQVGGAFDSYLVPIDACYDLVGRLRLYWHGFGGGEEVREQIRTFFDTLADRADLVVRPDGA